jgi:chaperonin GroES
MSKPAFPFKPLDDKLVVLPDEKADKSKGGILLPDMAKDRPTAGTVVAVGPGRWNDHLGCRMEMGVKVDDRVLYSRYSGNDAEIGGQEFKIMREADVFGVLVGETAGDA